MTQSPLPPPPGSPSPSQLLDSNRSLASARRAGMLLWVLGGFSVLAPLILLAAASADPKVLADQLMLSAPQEARQQLSQIDLPKFVRVFIIVAGSITLFIGLSLIGSAFSVRKGGLGGTIYAIVIVGLCIVWWLFNVLTGVIHLAGGALVGAMEIVFAGSISLVFGLCLVWLINSARAIASASKYRGHAFGQIQYPPGYASGYGTQPSIPLPPPPASSAQSEQSPSR